MLDAGCCILGSAATAKKSSGRQNGLLLYDRLPCRIAGRAYLLANTNRTPYC